MRPASTAKGTSKASKPYEHFPDKNWKNETADRLFARHFKQHYWPHLNAAEKKPFHENITAKDITVGDRDAQFSNHRLCRSSRNAPNRPLSVVRLCMLYTLFGQPQRTPSWAETIHGTHSWLNSAPADGAGFDITPVKQYRKMKKEPPETRELPASASEDAETEEDGDEEESSGSKNSGSKNSGEEDGDEEDSGESDGEGDDSGDDESEDIPAQKTPAPKVALPRRDAPSGVLPPAKALKLEQPKRTRTKQTIRAPGYTHPAQRKTRAELDPDFNPMHPEQFPTDNQQSAQDILNNLAKGIAGTANVPPTAMNSAANIQALQSMAGAMRNVASGQPAAAPSTTDNQALNYLVAIINAAASQQTVAGNQQMVPTPKTTLPPLMTDTPAQRPHPLSADTSAIKTASPATPSTQPARKRKHPEPRTSPATPKTSKAKHHSAKKAKTAKTAKTAEEVIEIDDDGAPVQSDLAKSFLKVADPRYATCKIVLHKDDVNRIIEAIPDEIVQKYSNEVTSTTDALDTVSKDVEDLKRLIMTVHGRLFERLPRLPQPLLGHIAGLVQQYRDNGHREADFKRLMDYLNNYAGTYDALPSHQYLFRDNKKTAETYRTATRYGSAETPSRESSVQQQPEPAALQLQSEAAQQQLQSEAAQQQLHSEAAQQPPSDTAEQQQPVTTQQ